MKVIEDGSFRLQVTTPLKTISLKELYKEILNQNDVDIDSTTNCITPMQIEF